jgi:hypothetical protein
MRYSHSCFFGHLISFFLVEKTPGDPTSMQGSVKVCVRHCTERVPWWFPGAPGLTAGAPYREREVGEHNQVNYGLW